MVLNSGETFSYNQTVGQRTEARGYKPAPAYVKGETVDEVGGGICQTSSTLYLACYSATWRSQSGMPTAMSPPTSPPAWMPPFPGRPGL